MKNNKAEHCSGCPNCGRGVCHIAHWQSGKGKYYHRKPEDTNSPVGCHSDEDGNKVVKSEVSEPPKPISSKKREKAIKDAVDTIREFKESEVAEWEERILNIGRIAHNSGYCIPKKALKQLLLSERQKGIKEERDRWISQPANEHDKKIRQDERQKCYEEMEGIIGEDEWEDPDIKGNKSHEVSGPHERNLYRAELRERIKKLR